MPNLVASDLKPRCRCCRKLLAEKVTRPWTIMCGRCKAVNTAAGPGTDRSIVVEEDTTLG
jgi:phage FluMu protein Com